ncbi:MAG: TIGR03560 family F420-dependent LLM class oxidoreductase [Sporichthyaceae bacterium]|nr:TIGR03560 family F420-dependent LLM class oxidoreductase [Sporichthyaceae bacterium]
MGDGQASQDREVALHLPSPCLVLLVGPGASGKSSWAAAHFPADTIVSSDRLRAMAGSGEHDLSASSDAFELLETIVRMRLGRRLTTVIDTLGLDPDRRRAWRELAAAHDLPCVAVGFDTAPEECRARNRARADAIPAAVLSKQLRDWARTRDLLPAEGYHAVLAPQPVRVVPPAFVGTGAAAKRQYDQPAGLRFGLQLATFDYVGGTATTGARLRDIAAAAEAAGFSAIYVMDHFRQIPQVGRAWDAMLDSYTALAYLAACTERIRIGTLVTGITYRNVAHLGKIVASLDVLSGGRAICGLGLAWFAAEHAAYGWEFPPVPRRYELLEDALQLLPLLWGPGSPAFQGTVLNVPEAMCYPRPLQEHVPIMIGGSGERRTLRLAARYADLSNVFGDPATVRHKAAVLREHCTAVGRDPAEVQLTQLSTALVGTDDAHVRALVDRLRPRRQDPARYAAAVHAGTVADHVGRFRELAEAGASEVMVRLPDLTDAEPVERMGKVITAFR